MTGLSTTSSQIPFGPGITPSPIGTTLAPLQTLPPIAPQPMPGAPAYPGLLDQLHLSSSPYAPPPVPVTPSLQPPAILTGLFEKLQDLVQRLFSPAPTPSTPAGTPPRRTTEFVISSFNVLGSSHTVPGGEKPNMASGPTRIRQAAQLLAAHKVDVVGFQELQGNQLREFLKVAGDRYAVYPGFSLGKREAVNSIAWRKDVWELVRPGSIEIPYFNGNRRKMPVVLLRHKQTGQEAYFANFHNPASTRRFPDQERWRDQATALEIDLVRRLRQESGLPVFVTGDMNEREESFDRFTDDAGMVAANEGPLGRPPKQMGIDWIFGTSDVRFSGYARDRSDLVKRTSDHPMIVSRARIGGNPR